MELIFNRYRLELFKKTMNESDYDFLYNEEIIRDGLFNIETKDEVALIFVKIKRVKYESFVSPFGQDLSDNLRKMYEDLINKLNDRK